MVSILDALGVEGWFDQELNVIKIETDTEQIKIPMADNLSPYNVITISNRNISTNHLIISTD